MTREFCATFCPSYCQTPPLSYHSANCRSGRLGMPVRWLDTVGVLVCMPKMEVRVAVWDTFVMVMVGMYEVGREQ